MRGERGGKGGRESIDKEYIQRCIGGGENKGSRERYRGSQIMKEKETERLTHRNVVILPCTYRAQYPSYFRHNSVNTYHCSVTRF